MTYERELEIRNVAEVAEEAMPLIQALKASGWTVHFAYTHDPDGAKFNLSAEMAKDA